MKRFLVFIIPFILFSCSLHDADNTGSQPDDGNVVNNADIAFRTALKSCKGVRIISLKRQVLQKTIAHYTLVIQIGGNDLDRIAIHRVVKERIPGIPIRNAKGVMALNGSPSNFVMDYLPSISSASMPAGQSMAIYLAENNLDIWGVDMRYALLPQETTDFSVLKDWDVSLEMKDIEFTLDFARTVREITGMGNDKMILTGISFGAFECYAMANAETQKPEILRNISAILPIDITFKFDPQYQNLKNAAFARYLDIENQMKSGNYVNIEGAGLIQVCALSKYTPDEPSPLIPGFTNKQTFLFLLTSTYAASTPPLEPYVPFYHYLTGEFDGNMMPAGLKYTDENTIYDLSLVMPAYGSQAAFKDFEALMSDMVDVPFDDHLSDIEVPVFYIGSAGGFGKYGLYTLELLGSTDKKSLIIKELPDELEALDYGHADVMWAVNAKELVWNPMLEWINLH